MKLTVQDAAQLFDVSEKSILRWIKSSQLPASQINSQYRFNRTDLLEWASAHRVEVSPDFLQCGDLPASPFSLGEAVQCGGVHYQVCGNDKRSVLKAVVELLRLPERVDRAMLLEVLLAREEMGSTAIGEGIAVPHTRNPIVLDVQRPLVTLCFLERPIEFDAIDGRPVSVLFTMVCPTIHIHLHLLSRLMFCLRDSHLRQLLAAPSSRVDIVGAIARAESALKDKTI